MKKEDIANLIINWKDPVEEQKKGMDFCCEVE
jgi:hypothetical protein